jgi:hypothetical protein
MRKLLISVDNFVQQQVFKEVAPLLVVGKLHSVTLKL